MGTPNPFLFGGQPPVDNPFMDSGTAEVNPFLAQSQPVQPQAYGYNQYGQMQVDPNNPYGAYNSMGYNAPAQPNMMYGYGDQQQQQQNQFYGQYGQMAHMNTHTNSVASNAAFNAPSNAAGAALFGVPTTTTPQQNAGNALFGVPATTTPQQNAGAALFGAPSQAADANPFGDVSATPQHVSHAGSMSGTPGTATPASIHAQPVVEANPFADAVATPQNVASPLGGSAIGTPHRGSISVQQIPEANPFGDVAAVAEPQNIKSPPMVKSPPTVKSPPSVKSPPPAIPQRSGTPGSSASQSVADANPFADISDETSQSVKPAEHSITGTPVVETATPNPFEDNELSKPNAEDSKKPEDVLVTRVVTPPSLLELEKPQNLVKEMVGGLEVSTADMMGKLEIAKTPTVPRHHDDDDSSDTESETESHSVSVEKPIIDIQDNKADDVPSIEIESTKEIKETDAEEKTTGFGEIFTAELAPNSETLQTATSFVDISDETKKEEDSDSDSDEDSKAETQKESDAPENESKETPSDGLMTGGTAAGLYDDIGFTPIVGGTGASLFGDEPMSTGPVKLSTGDAIFSDMPSVPDIRSTGAAIFGISDESAAGSTGAALFDIQAPEAYKPSHGEMSGWDDAFDQKFQVASSTLTNPNAAIDAFGGGVSLHTTPFGYPGDLSQQPDTSFCDSFGMAPVEADMNNPFKAEDTGLPGPGGKSTADGETPETPLFDSDVSKPLEPFPRLHYDGDGWEMFIRHPPKKKITSQRYWKKVWVRIVMQAENPAILLFNHKDDKDAFQELPLQAAYSLSDISHQVFDQYAKVFTIKLQYIFYKERAGIRPGQVTKMQKLTDKIGFLAKAVEDADYKGVKEFASDMKKLGVPLEHAPQISELLKLSSTSYEDMKMFSSCIEEKLFKIEVSRDRALTYKTEECQLTAVDEVYVEQDEDGHIEKQICRVRVFFISFLTGMPQVELGVNDMTRMGLEVVGRHDILPVPTEQWIRYEDIEFHHVVDKKAFEAEDHIIKFQPPDACYIEVMRFRTRPPKARELPIQARCSFQIIGQKVEIKADVMIPYHATKAWGQVPCEDVAVRIPLPECWIYQFRTEKHNMSLSQVRGALSTGNINLGTRMGSVKSAHRRAGKVKGFDRFLGTMETASQDLMETSSGQAKYEHQHKAIVWRVPRLPKQGQGSYTTHEFSCKLFLTSYDQVPETFEKHFHLEFTQPATSESYTVLRSVSIADGSGEPPEKFVKYLARHEYKVGIKFINEKEQDSYRAATAVVPAAPVPEEEPMREYEDFPEENGKRDSDSDSD